MVYSYGQPTEINILSLSLYFSFDVTSVVRPLYTETSKEYDETRST